MNKHTIFTIISFIFALFSGFVSASEDLFISSTNQDSDYKNNTLYFSGNVVVTQGNITIKADELFVYKLENGDKLIAKGKPAIFSQTEDDGKEISAQALEITYTAQGKILQLTGSAKFQQGGSLVESASIEFDLEAQRVKAKAGDNTDGRVTTRLKTSKD